MTNNDELARNPVLSYADSYRSMANQGAESVPVWGVITDLERNIAPLYAALLAERDADKKRIAEAYAGWGNCQLTMGVYCHAYEEAKAHITELIHNHRVHAARLIDERARLKERIAELEESHKKLRETMAAIHNTIRMDGVSAPLEAIMGTAKRAYAESAAVSGIKMEVGE